MTARWYVIHTHSGFEKKVAQAIRDGAVQYNLAELVEDVQVPAEDVIEIRRGQKINAERKLLPSYVLAKMEMNDQTYHLVKNNPKVTGFLGPKGKPTPISDTEAQRMLNTAAEAQARPKSGVQFQIGETVRISDGPFTSFNGQVEEIDEDRSRLKISVSIFGRPTLVELEFGQVEKA